MIDHIEYSYNGAKSLLTERGLPEECLEVARIWRDSGNREDRRDRLQDLGWRTEVAIPIGHLRPRFDAYKQLVAIEHEKKEQMRARWHMLKMEAHYQETQDLALGDIGELEEKFGIEVGVMIIPSGNDPSLSRTKRELEGKIFTEHFPIDVPIYVIEYETE